MRRGSSGVYEGRNRKRDGGGGGENRENRRDGVHGVRLLRVAPQLRSFGRTYSGRDKLAH